MTGAEALQFKTKEASKQAVQTTSPWHGRLRRKARWFAGITLLLVGVYVALAYRYYRQEVHIRRNYVAEFNAPMLAVPEELWAWTHYRRALVVLEPRANDEMAWSPSDKQWPAMVAYLKRNAEALAMLRVVAKLRPLGALVHDGDDPADTAWLVRQALETPQGAAHLKPPRENPELLATNFRHWHILRRVADILRADALLSAAENDGGRALDDIDAVVGIAEQASGSPDGQSYECHFNAVAFGCLLEMVASSPAALTNKQLALLAARLEREIGKGAIRASFDYDRAVFDDTLQRLYTDDGNDDGYLSPLGCELLDSLYSKSSRSWSVLRVPCVGRLFVATRRESAETYDRWMRYAAEQEALPRWQRSRQDTPLHLERNAGGRKFAGVLWLLPDVDGSLDQAECVMQTRDAAAVAVALVRYQRRHGVWPKSLAQLLPECLSAIPPDRFDGQAMRYRLIDDKPILYSIGADLDDDGGHPPPSEEGRAAIRSWPPNAKLDGDWMLWPPLANESQVDANTRGDNDR